MGELRTLRSVIDSVGESFHLFGPVPHVCSLSIGMERGRTDLDRYSVRMELLDSDLSPEHHLKQCI